MSQNNITVVNVDIADREDGGIRVSSKDLRGLLLSGDDKQKVISSIAPAIEAIFRHRGHGNVKVDMARPVSEIMDGGTPQDVDVCVNHEQIHHFGQYVVAMDLAA